MKRKTKQTLKTCLLTALGIGAVLGVASGVNAIVNKHEENTKLEEKVQIHPNWKIGRYDLYNDHKVLLNDNTCLTTDLFRCDGLVVELAKENFYEYDVAYYDLNKHFIQEIEDYLESTTFSFPSEAVYCSISFTAPDTKFNLLNMYNYTKDFKIYVDEKQENLKYTYCNVTDGYMYDMAITIGDEFYGSITQLDETENFKVVTLNPYEDKVLIRFDSVYSNETFNIMGSKDNIVVFDKDYDFVGTEFLIDVKGLDQIYFNLPKDIKFSVYEI